MTRKELIAYDKWLMKRKWVSGEIISPEKAADLYLAKHPLPPAEGAEQRIRVRNILQDFYRRGEYELEQAEEDIMRLFQQQPTAEGAEEITAEEFIREKIRQKMEIKGEMKGLWTYGCNGEDALRWAHDFATLHAQKLADKMVSERLREELIKYVKWYGSFSYENMTDEMLVNEYLKSRESHE